MATVINFAYDHRATVAVVLQLPDYFGCALIIYILLYIARGLLKSECLQDLLAV